MQRRSLGIFFVLLAGLHIVSAGCATSRDRSSEDPDKDGDPDASTTDSAASDSGDCSDAVEIPYNGLDDDCSAATPDDDLDGDGSLRAMDCADHDPQIHPGATERYYDGVDQDCSGGSDFDMDGDGADSFAENGGPDCIDDDPSLTDCGSSAATAVASCNVIKQSNAALPDGMYWIDPPDTTGAPFETFCDMTTDGGGYTFHKIDAGQCEVASEAEARCAELGMHLFIPRTSAHLASALRVASSESNGPSAGFNYLGIMGVYPNEAGARCDHRPLNSGSLVSCNWHASDDGAFFVSDRSDFGEPNGDGESGGSLAYKFTADGLIRYVDVPRRGACSVRWMCDVGDKQPPAPSRNETCDGHGVCACALGYAGSACDQCAPGFVEQSGRCGLANDGAYSDWPNPVSSANGDAWLAVHHEEIAVLRPKLLVLDFVNAQPPEAVAPLVEQVVNGFREGSRAHGYENSRALPQLEYDMLPIRDLRDGVKGRPAAPPGWRNSNSTIYPRRPRGDGSPQQVDYKQFYAPEYIDYLEIEDPAAPGTHVDLCTAVDSGLVNELWIVAAHEPGDAVPAEVLEHKQRYTVGRNKLEGDFDRCAGNGCFDVDTPHCARSLRIGFVNYERGPGCYLHSQGHGVERAANSGAVPAFREWFRPFAGFDLDVRYGLPFSSLYSIGCTAPPCISYPAPEEARFYIHGEEHVVNPYDAVCGNVHFPPNAQQDYDTFNPTVVASSCTSFGLLTPTGEPGAKTPVSGATWSANASISWDCGGEFLVWWYQNMPAHGTNQRFQDGRPMLSAWPFLFY